MDSVILFGRGKYFEEKKNSIFSLYRVKEIWDSSVEQESMSKYGNIPVINPANAVKDGTERILLVSVKFMGMWRFLVEMGFDPERFVLPYEIPGLYENDEAISHCVKSIVFERDEVIVTTFQDEKLKVHNENEWRVLLRRFYRETYPIIDAVSSMSPVPVSAQFGTERGTPIDRFYIETFLNANKQFIHGTVLEIEDNSYTKAYGSHDAVSMVMDVSSQLPGVDFLANLETGEGIREKLADCFICTQTLMYLYDTKAVAENIYRLLKPGGVVLLTCNGISQNSRRCMDHYGCTFNYNMDAFKKMFDEPGKFEILSMGSYGNVKTVCAHLSGLCQEDLREEDFNVNDKYYPLIVYAAVRRVNG